MADGFVEIIGAITQPINTLLEKASNAIGVLYEPTNIKRLAKAEIEINKLKLLSNIELSEIQNRATQRFLFVEAKRQENVEKVLEIAANSISNDAIPEEINEDWLFKFFDHVKDISDNEFQHLWAKILCGESENPRTYSKKLLSILSVVEKEDAILFRNLSQFCLQINDYTYPYILNTTSEIYRSKGVNFSNLLRLQALGLLVVSSGGLGGYVSLLNADHVNLSYFDKILFKLKRKKWDNGEYMSTSVDVGICLLTKEGLELLSVVDRPYNEDFIKYITEQIPSQGIGIIHIDQEDLSS